MFDIPLKIKCVHVLTYIYRYGYTITAYSCKFTCYKFSLKRPIASKIAKLRKLDHHDAGVLHNIMWH